MKLRCMRCGLVLEKCLSLDCVCPECDTSNWEICINPEDTMMGLTMKARDKSDRESLEMIEDLIRMRDIARKWVENWENLKKQEDLIRDPLKEQREAKEEGLAFEIFDIKDQKKVNVRKIYFDGDIEGFEGNPIIVNHAYPKFLKFKAIIVDMIRQINEDYMRLAERHIMADMPITTELDCLRKAYLERINNIKI